MPVITVKSCWLLAQSRWAFSLTSKALTCCPWLDVSFKLVLSVYWALTYDYNKEFKNSSPVPASIQSRTEYNRTCELSVQCSGNTLQQAERKTLVYWAVKVLGPDRYSSLAKITETNNLYSILYKAAVHFKELRDVCYQHLNKKGVWLKLGCVLACLRRPFRICRLRKQSPRKSRVIIPHASSLLT